MSSNNSEMTHSESVKEIKASGELSMQDYYRAHLGIFYTRPITIMMLSLMLVVVADLLFRYVYFRESTATMFWAFGIASIFVAVFGLPIGLRLQVKRLYDFNDFWAKKIKYSLNNKGIAISGKTTGKRYQWDEFKAIKEYKEFFLFQMNRFNVVVLPYRFLTPDEIRDVRVVINKYTANKKIKVKLKTN